MAHEIEGAFGVFVYTVYAKLMELLDHSQTTVDASQRIILEEECTHESSLADFF
jgi:hypothetical protein